MASPLTSSKEDLVALSEELKGRLSSARSGRKASLSTELRQDLLTALDLLAELASEAAFLDGNSDQPLSCHSKASASALDDDAPAENLTSKTPGINSAAELSELVTAAVSSSLTDWQTRFAEQLAALINPGERLDNAAGQAEAEQRLSAHMQELESELSDTRLQLSSANDQLAECQEELKYCREQLHRGEERIAEIEFSQLHATNTADDTGQLEQLKLQLDDSLNELADLREQNSELAAKLAQQVAHAATTNCSAGSGSAEQLSWEERKLLILKQLEGDFGTCSVATQKQEKFEIQEIIEASQLEINRRDAEIEELREIIRMQSEARNGVAIGAVGLAQMIDSDELVQQERQKLRDIQQEWETKLRQAEIELSMERAKIARERIAMEKQKEQLAQIVPSPVPKEKIVERRWLKILGLKDDGL